MTSNPLYTQDDNPLAEGGRDKGIRLVPFRVEFEKVIDKAGGVSDLAKLMEVSPTTIRKYRDGNQQPQSWACGQIAKACMKLKDVPIEWMYAHTWANLARKGEYE